MKFNAGLLFCLVLILFSGCLKKEKKTVKPKPVHEINIGVLGGIFDTVTKATNYHFQYYWHLDLVKDSFYVKDNFTMPGLPDSLTVKGGKFSFKNDSTIAVITRQAKGWKNGQKFFHKFQEGELYCFPVYTIQYKQDTLTRLIFFNGENDNLKALVYFLHELIQEKNIPEISSKIDLKDDSLARALTKRSDFDSFAPPTLVPMKIKFTPPVVKKKAKRRNSNQKKG